MLQCLLTERFCIYQYLNLCTHFAFPVMQIIVIILTLAERLHQGTLVLCARALYTLMYAILNKNTAMFMLLDKTILSWIQRNVLTFAQTNWRLASCYIVDRAHLSVLYVYLKTLASSIAFITQTAEEKYKPIRR